MTNDEAIPILLKWRFPDTDGSPVCPICSGNDLYFLPSRSLLRWLCKHCEREFSIFTGTIFQNNKLPLRIYAEALSIVRSGQMPSAYSLAILLGVSFKTAYSLRERIVGSRVTVIRAEPPHNPRMKPWPEERKANFIAAWKSGASAMELAAVFGHGWQYWKRKLDLPGRRSSSYSARAAKGGAKAPWVKQEKILRASWPDFINGELTRDSLCNQINRSWTAIRAKARLLGLPKPPSWCADCGDLICGKAANAHLCQKCRGKRDQERLILLRNLHNPRQLDHGKGFDDAPLLTRVILPSQKLMEY
jgi:transposase-like protein